MKDSLLHGFVSWAGMCNIKSILWITSLISNALYDTLTSVLWLLHWAVTFLLDLACSVFGRSVLSYGQPIRVLAERKRGVLLFDKHLNADHIAQSKYVVLFNN